MKKKILFSQVNVIKKISNVCVLLINIAIDFSILASGPCTVTIQKPASQILYTSKSRWFLLSWAKNNNRDYSNKFWCSHLPNIVYTKFVRQILPNYFLCIKNSKIWRNGKNYVWEIDLSCLWFKLICLDKQTFVEIIKWFCKF